MRSLTILLNNNNIAQSLIHQLTIPTTKLDYLTDLFTGKPRRRVEESISTINRDSSSNSNENVNEITVPSLSSELNNLKSVGLPYLESEFAVFTRSIGECNIGELIRQPEGVDQNEWIAINIVSFFNHINDLYDGISDFCTTSTCPLMIGPQNSLYYWIDERGKKVKYSAPQYIELTMTFIQKNLSNENIFPTRLDIKFPSTFLILIRKMVRLLYHCLSHIYAVHYVQLIEYDFHPHLNSLFLHFISFLIKSDLIGSDNSNINQIETRELRSEIECLSVLYQLLAKQWQYAYAQASAQKRKLTNNQ